MEQTENGQRPRQRQQEIKQRTGIENQGVPLGQKGKPAIVEWIPEWDFSLPEASTMVMRQWIAEKSEVSIVECLQSEQDLRVGRKNGHRQEKRKTSRRQPEVDDLWISIFLPHSSFGFRNYPELTSAATRRTGVGEPTFNFQQPTKHVSSVAAETTMPKAKNGSR